MFAIYDSKAGAFLSPFFSINTATAVRDFSRAANDADTQFFVHAADYSLMEIATWNPDTGELVPHVAHVNLGTALTFQQSLVEVPS